MFLAGIDIDRIIGFKLEYIPSEFISAILVMIIISIVAIIVGIKAKRADPLERPKGILNLAEILVEFTDKQVLSLMGPRFKNFGGYILALGLFIFGGFIIGLCGFSTPFTYLGIPLVLAFCTFFAIHFTSIRFKHWGYFKRYVEPLPFFLPINLISMWAPVISLSFRLFGNALAGYCVMTMVYLALSFPINGANVSFGFVVTPFLHAYFDVFSGLIQMAVFTILTMVNVAQEAPTDVEEVAQEQFA